MKLNKNSFESAKHILIVTKNDSFANASALYSYLLTLHKKVSLYKTEEIESNFAFLPWFDKVRESRASSADYIFEMSADTRELFEFFLQNGIKINKKMATALYAGLFKRYDAFMSDDCDGTIFAICTQLIAMGAEQRKVKEQMLYQTPLSLFRLRATLFKSMLLQESGSSALLFISDDDLRASGATLEDAYKIMQEVTHLVHVRKVTLLKSDEEHTILKTITIEKEED